MAQISSIDNEKWLASSLQPASPTISMQEWPWLLVTVSYNGCLLPVASPVTWICLKTQNNQPQVWHSEMLILLFPTCQVRVVRFYASCPASSFSFLLLRRTSTARSRSQCSPANPSSNLWIKVILPDPNSNSDPRRTSTASSGSECSPPDLNHKESPKIYQIECQKECQKISQIDMPQKSVRENAR